MRNYITSGINAICQYNTQFSGLLRVRVRKCYVTRRCFFLNFMLNFMLTTPKCWIIQVLKSYQS